MASRESERRSRREQRRRQEAEAAARERRGRMVKLASAAVLLAFVAIAVAIAVSQSGGGDDGGGGDVPQSEARLLETLPQKGNVLGEPSAPVTIEEFGDLQCPACAQASQTFVPDLIAGPVRRGEVKLEFRNWVILGPQSVPAAEAAFAAAEQDRAWNFVTEFYAQQGAENSGYVTDDYLTGIAEDAGLPDIERWQRDRERDWGAQLDRVERDAGRLGLTGTPAFVLRGRGAPEVLAPPLDLETVEAAIDDAR